MLGATWAFFNQGIFGKRIALPIFLYFAGLAAWYAAQYHFSNQTKKVQEPVQQEEKIQKKEVAVRWTVSDTIPPEWNITEEHLDKILGKTHKSNYGQNEWNNQ